MCEKSSQIVPKMYLSLFYRTKYLMEIHMLKSVRFIHIKMGWPPNRAENDTKGQTKLSGLWTPTTWCGVTASFSAA